MLKNLFFTAYFLFTLAAHAQSEPCDQRHCMIVVDAGSTGSRMHLYAYDLDKNSDPINITEVNTTQIKPGLASITPSPEAIQTYLTTLLIDIPSKKLPVYFYATAGMRLLAYQKQKTYYSYIQSWFHNHPSLQLVDSKTISGTDEGIYGWLAVNYTLGTLNQANAAYVGVMDMGGASVEITFPAPDETTIPSQDKATISIYGHTITLFVHSFLGLGQTEVTHHFLDEKACFPENYPLPSGELAKGDLNVCKAKLETLINQVHHVHDVINPALKSYRTKTWYVMGGLSEMAQDPPLSFNQAQVTPIDLANQADQTVCHQSWDALSMQYPTNEYQYMNCLTAAYYYELTVNGYGLPANAAIHYFSRNEKNTDWTLGVVLHH